MKGEEVKEVREMHNYGDCSFCGGKVKSDKVELVYQYRGKLYIFQNGYTNEELSYYCHTDYALCIPDHASPRSGIFEMRKAALITGISGQDACRVGRTEKRTFVVKLHV